MLIRAFVFVACILLPVLSTSNAGTVLNCVEATAGLQSMELRDAQLEGPGQQRIGLKVRVADTSSERAAGFQHICPEVANETSILFLLQQSYIPSFHMNNVLMPLDIAFIDENGIIRDIQTMHPYVLGKQTQTRFWKPGVPVNAALEVKAGLFDKLGVTVDDWSVSLLK